MEWVTVSAFRSVRLIMYFFALFPMLLCVTRCRGSLLQEDGVMVVEDGQARMVSGVWTVVVVLQSPRQPNISALQRQTLAYEAMLGDHVTEVDTAIWRTRLLNVENLLQMGRARVGEEEKETRAPGLLSRVRRGVIDLVGNAAKFMFGLATQQDILRVMEVVRKLRGETGRLLSSDDSMISVINATRLYVRENREDVKLLEEQTKKLRVLTNLLLVNSATNTHAIRKLQVKRSVDQ